MELNKEVLHDQTFRFLKSETQIVYIYGSLLADENGMIEDIERFEQHVSMTVAWELESLREHGLIRYYPEHDSFKVIKNPKLPLEFQS